MLKALVRLAIPMFLVGAIGGCQEEIGSQNPNAPAGGHAEGGHDQADPYAEGAAPGGAGGAHAQ